MTLFLVGILIGIALLILGVVRHWHWLCWLLLVAFSGSVIEIPLEVLHLVGLFLNPYLVWYSLFRAGVGSIELNFAIWMIQISRCCGVWSMGRKR